MIHPKPNDPAWRQMDEHPDGWVADFKPRQRDLIGEQSDTHLVAIKIVDVLGNEDVFVYEVPRNGDGKGVLVRREWYPIPIMEKEVLKRVRRQKRRAANATKAGQRPLISPAPHS